jgi:Tat protein translocase TatC
MTQSFESNFTGHNKELFYRFLWYLFSVCCLIFVAYKNDDQIAAWWVQGVEDAMWNNTNHRIKMQYVSLGEGVQSWLIMILVWAFMFSLPVLYYQIAQFLKPGLHKKEWYSLVIFGIGGAFVSFFLGCLFFMYILWPRCSEILFGFNVLDVTFEPRLASLLLTYIKMCISFSFASMLPWLQVMLVLWNIISYERSVHFRKWFLLLILCIATLFSPPDVFSQFIIGLPLWFFFELGWFFLAFREVYKKKTENYVRT